MSATVPTRRATIPHAIRAYDPGRDREESYVYDNWIRCLADDLDIPDSDKERGAFWRAQKKAIGKLLERSTALVACSPRDENTIFGFIVAEPPERVHFVYVRKNMRGGGICRALVEAARLADVCTATSHTSWGFPRLARLFERLDLEPIVGGDL
jgi:hypothetical protein